MNRRLPRLLPVTDFRSDAASAIKTVQASNEPVIITQRGRAAAVMLSVEAFERGEHEREILLELARGEREIKQGKGNSLEQVLADLDDLFRKEGK